MSDEVISEVPPVKRPTLCKRCEKVPVPTLGADHGLCNTCWWAERREAKKAAPAAPPPPPSTHEEYAAAYHDAATFACPTCGELAAKLARTPDQQAAAVTDLTFPPKAGAFVVLPGDVIDGDGLHFYWLIADKARLHGINAPELRGPNSAAGRDAKTALEILIGDSPLRATVHGRDKYGRALLDLTLPDGRSVSAVMVELKHAVPWDGKGQKPE